MTFSRHKQRGLSLVELMVALALGMVLMAGFVQIFMSVRSTYAVNEASSRMQENGRFALEFISQHARMAGYRDPKHIDRPLAIMPPQNPDAGCTLPSDKRPDFCTLNEGVINGAEDKQETGDRVAFVYQPPLDENNQRLDCVGNPVPAAYDDKNIVNVFSSVAFGTSTALACRSIFEDGTAIPGSSSYVELVDGIDAVQFQYGLANDNNESSRQSVVRYVTADQLTNKVDWERVIALRIAVLANSVNPVSPAPPEKDYYLLDAGPYKFNDGKMRQVFTTTVYLRNSLQ